MARFSKTSIVLRVWVDCWPFLRQSPAQELVVVSGGDLNLGRVVLFLSSFVQVARGRYDLFVLVYMICDCDERVRKVTGECLTPSGIFRWKYIGSTSECFVVDGSKCSPFTAETKRDRRGTAGDGT